MRTETHLIDAYESRSCKYRKLPAPHCIYNTITLVQNIHIQARTLAHTTHTPPHVYNPIERRAGTHTLKGWRAQATISFFNRPPVKQHGRLVVSRSTISPRQSRRTVQTHAIHHTPRVHTPDKTHTHTHLKAHTHTQGIDSICTHQCLCV